MVLDDSDFQIGQMADTLVTLSIKLCGNKEEKTPRFPRFTYDTYTNKILEVSLIIQENCIIGNQSSDVADRLKCQTDAMRYCIYYNHLIRIANDNKWISDKQRDKASILASTLFWKISKWKK